MSAASRGAAFERQVRGHLQSLGWYCERSPASHGAADLVATSKADLLFIQARINGRMDPGEWDALYQLAQRYGGTAILVDRGGRAASRPRGVVRWRMILGPKGPGRRGVEGPCEEWTPYPAPEP